MVVARGELVEIGDGFRIPELLESVGAHLREVGTTNRVRPSDYADAVGRAHRLRAQGAPLELPGRGLHLVGAGRAELATLPVPVVADLGSGLLAPHPRLPDEPDAATALRAGAALVTASGDKLLGGPQAGCCSVAPTWCSGCAAHPFARALRVDKLTLAALEATLRGPGAPGGRRAGARPRRSCCARAERIAETLGHGAPTAVVVAGGRRRRRRARGRAAERRGVAPRSLVEPLRFGEPPVVGHVADGRLLLDLVAVPAGDDGRLRRAGREPCRAGRTPAPPGRR